LTRVLPDLPFGRGIDGDYNSSTIPTMTYQSCSGTSGSKTLNLGASDYSNGDVLLIIQMRGSGAGQWELNQISSGGGTSTLTLAKNLQYTYTDGGASQAQCIKVPQYTNVTIQSGTWNVSDWGGNTGGILVFAARGIVTINGSINANGSGFDGGAYGDKGGGGNQHGGQGEGSAGAGTRSASANGSGGGGGTTSTEFSGWFGAGGGGGGYGSSGSGGGTNDGSATPGSGGNSVGNSGLTSLFLGGGGGGGGADTEANPDKANGGHGGDGGGAVLLFAKNISVNGSISSSGLNGLRGEIPDSGNKHGGGGGGGAGGSLLFVCETASLGNNKVQSRGGSGGIGTRPSEPNDGGAGASGRIAVYHSGPVTGTTTPAFTDVTDPDLVERIFTAMV